MDQQKIEYFESKQKEILEAHAGLEKFRADVIKEFEGKLKPWQDRLQKLTEEYRAELKAEVGFTDGEQTNVLDLVKAVLKLSGKIQ